MGFAVTFVVGFAVGFAVALVVTLGEAFAVALDVAFLVGVGEGFLVAALALPHRGRRRPADVRRADHRVPRGNRARGLDPLADGDHPRARGRVLRR